MGCIRDAAAFFVDFVEGVAFSFSEVDCFEVDCFEMGCRDVDCFAVDCLEVECFEDLAGGGEFLWDWDRAFFVAGEGVSSSPDPTSFSVASERKTFCFLEDRILDAAPTVDEAVRFRFADAIVDVFAAVELRCLSLLRRSGVVDTEESAVRFFRVAAIVEDTADVVDGGPGSLFGDRLTGLRLIQARWVRWGGALIGTTVESRRPTDCFAIVATSAQDESCSSLRGGVMPGR